MAGAKYNDRDYGARRDALRRLVAATGEPCWLCGEAIDLDADWRDPKSFTADHVEALANGGALLGELRPAHRGCNSRRGAQEPVSGQPVTSQPW